MTNEEKAKEICDCDSCKACIKFAEEGNYALNSTCNIYEKAYKDALERAKYWANNPTVWSSDDICQKLFPKIVEKKDESIKSCIGMCLTDVDNQRFEDYDTSLKDCLAWLEKQGEQKPAWSEEDEKIIETMCKEGDLRPSQMIWLKSLKDRFTWKPNVEQLTAFAMHLQKRGAFCDDLCMDFEHEAQSFIEFQNRK